MIDDEIAEILVDRTDDGRRLNQLVDEFRRGRSVAQVTALLDSKNPGFVSIGAWILGELPLDLYRSDDILSRLRNLTGHFDPMVRFHAIGALFPALNPIETGTRDLLQKLLSDPNDGVRKTAQMATNRLSLK